ncbi:MAG: universal stress protein [Eggerthellaceae bacterium]|jgi:nucleotide-binding universal stress UspA family protein
MAEYKRIFAALDGGTTQELVARRAIEIAKQQKASLLFGHVVDSVPYEAHGVDFGADFADLCDSALKRIEDDLADVLAEARASSEIPSVEIKVRAGRINDTLADSLIEPYEPDLVICAARGLSNIRYAFVGSVSTFLIRNMDCDVLVIKPKEEQDA